MTPCIFHDVQYVPNNKSVRMCEVKIELCRKIHIWTKQNTPWIEHAIIPYFTINSFLENLRNKNEKF